MKKILLTVALTAFAIVANAQLYLSANIGGAMTSGSVSTRTVISITENKDTTVIADLDKTSLFTGGLKVGYKIGKAQFGLSGCFSRSVLDSPTLDTVDYVLNPMIAATVTGGNTQVTTSSFTVAPYFRYDVLQLGDIAIFAELDFVFAKTMPSKVNSHIDMDIAGQIQGGDTVMTRRVSATNLGVQVVPGMSWQLNKHCSLDLYLDFLSLAYSRRTTESVRNKQDYTYEGILSVLAGTETITTTETTTEFGGGITGTPLLTSLGVNNWVRVGFNFSF